MRWEYTVVVKTDSVDFVEALNQLGEQGWEAVSGNFTIGEIGSEEVPGGPPLNGLPS